VRKTTGRYGVYFNASPNSGAEMAMDSPDFFGLWAG
jgi:hypothetical protein